jgi:hypothetical protein
MEARSLSDGISSCSSGEFHEHGESKRMVESQEEVPRPITKIRI